MPGKTPHSNGNEPVENGIRPNQDVDMKDDTTSSLKAKGKKAAKEGEDEMTVVVPPSKAQRQSSAAPPPDVDGDVAMGDEEKADDGEVKVDPVVQTVSGASRSPSMTFLLSTGLRVADLLSPVQTLRVILLYWTVPLPCSMPDSPCERSVRSPRSVSG
jgi:hypothetical protein